MSTGLSNRAAGLAVLVAFASGLLLSLALRTPGSAPAQGSAQTDAGGTSQQPNLRWRVPVAFGTNLPALGDNILYVSAAAAAASNGAINLEVFEPGELVPPLDIVDAVRAGKVPAGYTWLGYDQGKIPASPLISAVPFGMEPWEYMAWWYEAGGQQLAEELYQGYGVLPLLCGLIGPETAGWFRQPLKDLDDVRGLKIRFAGLGGRVLEQLGASVTMIPGGEIFQALEKGAIDASEYSLPVVDQKLGFDRVAHYNLFPGWHQTFTAAHLVVNLDTWNQLAASQQATLRTTCTAGVTRNLARAEALQGPVIAGFADRGVTAQSLPLPLLRELQRISNQVMAAEAARDPDFARILNSQQAFRKTYQLWKQLGYLPRDF